MSNEEELLEFIKDLGIKEFSKSEKKALFDLIKERGSLDVVKKELEVLYALNRVLLESYSKVSVSNMLKINSDIDETLLVQLFFTFNKIKSQSKSEKLPIVEFKQFAHRILVNNTKTNLVINELVNEEYSRINQIKNVLYFSMLDKEKADKLFDNCQKRCKEFLNTCDLKNLTDLIEYLKENYQLKDEELVNISSRCATFFVSSSASKLKNLHDILEDFKHFITNGLQSGKNSKAMKLLDRDFKDVLSNAPSFATASPNLVKETIRFLSGESLGDIKNDIEKDVLNLKGNFTPIQLAKIYNDSITSLMVPVNKIAKFSSNINIVFRKHFGNELNLSELINGNNFSSLSQLRSEDFLVGGKVEKIFELLKLFVSGKDMEILLQNNVSFLIADVKEVKEGLKKAILTATNDDQRKVNILHEIRTHFGRYQSLDKEFERTPSLVSKKMKKVNMLDMNESELVNVLSKLNTTDKDIDLWKSKWNGEEKELRQLQLQIDLEDIITNLISLDEMLDIGFVSIEQFTSEDSQIRDLFNEIVSKQEQIVSSNRLTKELKELNNRINQLKNAVVEKLDRNVNLMIDYNNSQISELNKLLIGVTSSKDKYDSISQQISKLTQKIEQENINDESLKKEKQKIDEIGKVLSIGDETMRLTIRQENTANKLLNEFYDLLTKEDSEAIITRKAFLEEGYRNADYLFGLLAYILIRDQLITTDVAINPNVIDLDDRMLTYREYEELLSSNAKKYANEIYDIFYNNKKMRRTSILSVCKELEANGYDISKIHTIHKALFELRKTWSQIKEHNRENITLIESKKRLIQEKETFDIEKIDTEINKLKDLIEGYNTKINELNKMKINR